MRLQQRVSEAAAVRLDKILDSSELERSVSARPLNIGAAWEAHSISVCFFSCCVVCLLLCSVPVLSSVLLLVDV